MLTWPSKDPNERLDYQIDWTLRMEDGETIATSAVTVSDATLTIDTTDFVGLVVTIWLKDGTDRTNYVVTNRITTSAGRIYDQSVRLRVKSH